jgi:hypothetical protein
LEFKTIEGVLKKNLRPYKIGVGVWIFEKNNFAIGRAVGNQMNLEDIEQYAFNEIDNLIKKKKKFKKKFKI